MKEIILRRLRLLNFKGIRNLVIDFDEHETNIFGANGSGKSTVFDAFYWLLFGKNGNERKDFNIKTLGKDGRAIERLPHEVEAVIEVDGQEITLKKTYNEIWAKKRGSAVETFNGHSIECFYNEVPVKATEYADKVDEICNEQVFKLITSPIFFSSQRRDVQRAMLLQLAGEISTEDLVKENPEFQEIVNELTGKTLEEYKREVASKKRKIKEGVESIPARIDERLRDMPLERDWEQIEADIKSTQVRIDELDAQLSDRSKGYQEILREHEKAVSQHAEASRSLSCIRAEMEGKLLAEYYTAKREHESALSREATMMNDRRIKGISLPRLETELAELTATKEQMLADYKKIIAEKFVVDPDALCCPTCKRQYETDESEAIIERMSQSFEDDKKRRKNSNIAKGKEIAAKIVAIEAEIKAIKDAIFNIDEDLSILRASETYKNEPSRPNVEDEINNSPEVIALVKEEERLKELASKPVNLPDDNDLKELKKAATEELVALRSQLKDRDIIASNNERIEALKKEYQEGQAEITRLEGIEFTIQQFGKARIEQVEERINSQFSIVRFKLFEKQINGGEVETCEAMVNGVPFADLNNAGQINAGLDIINAICKNFGIVAPIFIDNRESVTDIISTPSQVINLIVDSNCKTLKID